MNYQSSYHNTGALLPTPEHTGSCTSTRLKPRAKPRRPIPSLASPNDRLKQYLRWTGHSLDELLRSVASDGYLRSVSVYFDGDHQHFGFRQLSAPMSASVSRGQSSVAYPSTCGTRGFQVSASYKHLPPKLQTPRSCYHCPPSDSARARPSYWDFIIPIRRNQQRAADRPTHKRCTADRAKRHA